MNKNGKFDSGNLLEIIKMIIIAIIGFIIIKALLSAIQK